MPRANRRLLPADGLAHHPPLRAATGWCLLLDSLCYRVDVVSMLPPIGVRGRMIGPKTVATLIPVNQIVAALIPSSSKIPNALRI